MSIMIIKWHQIGCILLKHVIIIVIHLLNPKYIGFFLVGINIITKTFLSKTKIDVILKYSNTIC